MSHDHTIRRTAARPQAHHRQAGRHTAAGLVVLLAICGWSAQLAAQPPTSGAASAPPTPLPSLPASAAPAAPAAPAQGTPQGPAAPQATPAPQPSSNWQPDNRLTLGADGATLTGTNGGGGGDIGYLDEPNPDTTLGVGAQYQRLANAYWGFGSLSVAFSHTLTAHSRWDVHAEADEGDGNSADHSFRYNIINAGFGLAVPGGIAADLQDSRLDVDTSYGYLPKLALAKAWGPHWLTTIAYAQSYGGNLDTNYALARVDFYGRGFGLLGGADIGRVSPAVVNIDGVLRAEARHLTEAFLGVSKTIARVDLSLLGDNIDLVGIRHFTLTLNCTIHLR